MNVATLWLLRTLQSHFLGVECFGRDFDVHVVLDGDLATEPFALGGVFLVDVILFGGQDLAAALMNLDFALGAGAAAAAGATDEHTGVGQRPEQFPPGGNFDRLLVVDQDLDRSRCDQLALGSQDQQNQRDDDDREHRDAENNDSQSRHLCKLAEE